ncbi:aldo/keto reductase [Thiorhodococcus mannitoliphagus]
MNRRSLIKLFAAAAATATTWRLGGAATPDRQPVRKPIPSSNEALTVIGMGTWQSFNVGSDRPLRDARTEVLRAFFAGGGQLVDSSPMYGSSQDVLGDALDQLGHPEQCFSADKVWTRDGDQTRAQTEISAAKWRTRRFDLLQVHNLLSWEAHLETLADMKASGEVRYIGVTTSHGRRHRELEQVMRSQALDFVQLTYNPVDREVETRLLPLARERGIAVIANRPFRGGSLVDTLQRSGGPLPAWAAEVGCHNWPQLVLKWIVSHPAVTCAIPATTRVDHMQENMGAAIGDLPDAKLRARMLAAIQAA